MKSIPGTCFIPKNLIGSRNIKKEIGRGGDEQANKTIPSVCAGMGRRPQPGELLLLNRFSPKPGARWGTRGLARRRSGIAAAGNGTTWLCRAVGSFAPPRQGRAVAGDFKEVLGERRHLNIFNDARSPSAPRGAGSL